MTFEITVKNGNCKFHYFKNINSVFIKNLEDVKLKQIQSKVKKPKIDCYAVLADAYSLNTFLNMGFTDVKSLPPFYLLYKGDRSKLFATIYHFFKESFDVDPFYNKEFRKIAFSINESKAYKTDSVVLF